MRTLDGPRVMKTRARAAKASRAELGDAKSGAREARSAATAARYSSKTARKRASLSGKW